MIEKMSKMDSKDSSPSMVNYLLDFLETRLFVTRSVGEIISGYNDPLMELAKMSMPKVVKDDKFSLMSGVCL